MFFHPAHIVYNGCPLSCLTLIIQVTKFMLSDIGHVQTVVKQNKWAALPAFLSGSGILNNNPHRVTNWSLTVLCLLHIPLIVPLTHSRAVPPLLFFFPSPSTVSKKNPQKIPPSYSPTNLAYSQLPVTTDLTIFQPSFSTTPQLSDRLWRGWGLNLEMWIDRKIALPTSLLHAGPIWLNVCVCHKTLT